MAQTTLVPKIPLRTEKVNSQFKKSSKSLLQTQKSVVNINSLLKKRIKVRNEIFSNIFESKRRREYETRRMELEDERESRKSVVSGAVGNIAATVSKTGGSLIGRLMKSLGFIVAGWILRSLPTWIGYAKEFIARISELGRIIRSFITNVGNIFQSSINVLSALKDNILKFDFFDSQRNLKNSFDELGKSIEGVQKDFKDTIDVFTTDLTKEIDGVTVGSYSGEAIPEPGQGFTEDAPSQTQTYDSGSSSSGGGGANLSTTQKQALSILSKYESAGAGNYNAVNQIGVKGGRGVLGYSGDFRKMKQHGGKALTDMTIAEIMDLQAPRPGMSNQEWIRQGRLHAVGRYQFIGGTLPGVVKRAGIPTSAKFTPEVQDLLAMQYLKEVGIGAWIGPSDKATAEERAVIERARKEPINYKPQISQGNSQTTQQPQKAISTPSTTLTGGEYFKPLPQGSFKGGVGQVFGAGREGRSHLGIDITESNWKPGSDPRIPVVAIRGGIVISDKYNPNPSSYTAGVMIRQDDGYDVRYLHMAPSVKPGDKIQSGQQIGRLIPLNGRSVGMPGNDTHLHLELYKGSQLLDPTSYIRSIESGAKPKAQITPTPTQKAQQQVAQQITPERKAQDIVAVVPQSSPQQPAASQGSTPSQQQSAPSMGEVLNNFIKQKFLLDLSFL